MKIFNRHLDQAGVTLIEMLIVMGLLSILLVVMATIFTSAADVQQQSRSYSATISNGRFIMARLNYDIARASSIVSPASPGASTSALELDIGGTDYTYNLAGNNLQLTDGIGTDNLNSDDVVVSNPNFEEVSGGGGLPTILYNFTLTSTALSNGSADTQTFTSAAGLR